MSDTYEALTPETLGQRLGGIDALTRRIGPDATAWTVREVGDGNLNLVFIVEGTAGTAIVKQALPYVRLVGESWPLPLNRAFFEYHALTRQAARDPGRVPEIYHYDEAQALIVMEYLNPHIILRQQMMAGRRVEGLGRTLGEFCARTAFRGSDLCMQTRQKKADVALFSDNVDLCDITENLVFTDPYFDAEMNRHTSPQLDGVVAELRQDQQLKIVAQHFKRAFTAKAETMCHGDLHTGSIMVTDHEAKIIDPEFAFYGPMGFDIGMLLGNYLMAFLAMPGHIGDEAGRAAYQDWLLEVIGETWTVFAAEFEDLWHSERTGILYPKTLYEDQGHDPASDAALREVIGEIFTDALAIAGIEMHRRILGLAHIAEFDTIEDAEKRAPLEAKALRLGRTLVLGRAGFAGIDQVIAAARRADKGASA
ncbi:MAG: S-methyl-5-thioribose kinase [Roseitalea porphyridii]|uniref:S-methyl-5-thioribose kinase n=1 Tax=Roseitalea porphyridii TaxID=1852022 RepID=UPI0032D8D14B